MIIGSENLYIARIANGMMNEFPCVTIVDCRGNKHFSVLTGKGEDTMIDREKVIKGLEICSNIFKGCEYGCPYYNEIELPKCNQLKKDAIALLKEQEAKCLTKAELDDLNESQFVWIEGRTGYLYCLQIIGICRDKTGVSDIQFNAVTSYVEKSTNLYGDNYRIWTNKPTEEQKKEVKWE